jgi:hypothetical protein
MWTRRITSGSEKYPTRQSVIDGLLRRMIEKGIETSWTHFEVVDRAGWFRNLFWGRGVWIEVALLDERNLQLNPGSLSRFPTEAHPPVPPAWPQDKQGMWTVPVGAVGELSDWLELTLTAVAKDKDCKITGWIDGI